VTALHLIQRTFKSRGAISSVRPFKQYLKHDKNAVLFDGSRARHAYSGPCIDLRNLHFSELGLQIYRLTVRRSGSYDPCPQALRPRD
jgi:hypothetical protein